MTISLGSLGVAPKVLYRGCPLVPAAPYLQTQSTATTGGSIAASTTVAYKITAVIGGVETAPSNELSQVTGSGTSTNTVTISWVPVIGATGYKIYGRTSGSLALLATVGAVTSWTDTGSATPGASIPTGSGFSEATATPGLYVAPAGKVATVQRVLASNPNLASASLSLSVVPSGGAGGASNRVLAGYVIKPDREATGPQQIELAVPLQAGDFITGQVSVSGVIITILGSEVPA